MAGHMLATRCLARGENPLGASTPGSEDETVSIIIIVVVNDLCYSDSAHSVPERLMPNFS
jgi:hypothetical protein